MEMKKVCCQCLVHCDACPDGTTTKLYGSIRLGCTDPEHRYIGSKRKMMANYKWQLCPKHYKVVLDKIKESIKEI